MKKLGVKLLILVMGLGGTGVALFFVWSSDQAMKALPMPELSHEEKVQIEAELAPPAPHGAHGAKAEGHGEAKAEGGHGGGHGEAKAEGHGEAKAEEGHGGGHGEAKAEEGHGGGHGGAERKPSSGSSGGLPLVSFDELFVNVMANQYSRSLALKLELELFDEENRSLVDERQSAVKDTVLATAREQDYFRLSTISGKLYFKELLVGRINQYFKKPVVKDVHFSSFFLQ